MINQNYLMLNILKYAKHPFLKSKEGNLGNIFLKSRHYRRKQCTTLSLQSSMVLMKVDTDHSTPSSLPAERLWCHGPQSFTFLWSFLQMHLGTSKCLPSIPYFLETKAITFKDPKLSQVQYTSEKNLVPYPNYKMLWGSRN